MSARAVGIGSGAASVSALERRGPLRLFCFPYAGGSAAVYSRWPRLLGRPELELHAVELPGRGRRREEPALTDFFALVVRLAEELRPHLEEPFALFGHSLGALIAFELARYGRREWGVTPACLVASACAGPRLPWRFPDVRTLSDAELMREASRRFGGIPADVLEDPGVWDSMVPALRADLTAGGRFRYHEELPLTCPVVTLGGIDDPAVTEADLAAWSLETLRPLQSHRLEGGHFFVLDAWEQVARLVDEALQGAGA